MILNDEQQNLIQSAKKGFNLWVTLEDIIHAPLMLLGLVFFAESIHLQTVTRCTTLEIDTFKNRFDGRQKRDLISGCLLKILSTPPLMLLEPLFFAESIFLQTVTCCQMYNLTLSKIDFTVGKKRNLISGVS